MAEDTRVKNLDQVVDQDPHLREDKCLFIVDCQKEVFNNARFKKIYAVVNVGLLEESFEDGAQINEQSLRDHGIVKGKYDGIKILGDGDISKKFNISANKVSHTAKDKIEKAGGSVESIVKNEDLPADKTSQPKEDA